MDTLTEVLVILTAMGAWITGMLGTIGFLMAMRHPEDQDDWADFGRQWAMLSLAFASLLIFRWWLNLAG